MKPVTTIIALAGRTSANTSPCARPASTPTFSAAPSDRGRSIPVVGAREVRLKGISDPVEVVTIDWRAGNTS